MLVADKKNGLQEPYSDEESQASAQTVATATGEAISVQADKAAAAAAITKQAPTSKSLERQTTKYFDAGKFMCLPPLFLVSNASRTFSGDLQVYFSTKACNDALQQPSADDNVDCLTCP